MYSVFTFSSFIPVSKFFALNLKGIVQPFELGGETRLIRSPVLTTGPAFFKKLFNDTISREENKTIFSGLRISEMTLSNQSHFPRFFSPSHLLGFFI